MERHASLDTEALLREVGWVQSLARRLVRDAAEAEDVAQDALLVALRGARREPLALRQWLGKVVRNLARSSRRRRVRRTGAELPAEPRDDIPSSLELLERATTQRALVGALLELEETDRSALLLHHYEGLSNVEIARHWSVPPSTVASRLARAHARLRAKWLAQNGDDRGTALAALVVCAQGGGRPWPAATASVRVASAAPVAAGIASVLLGVAWWSLSSGAHPVPATSVASLATATAAIAADAARPDVGSRELLSFLEERRSPVETSALQPAPVCPAPDGQRVPIAGRVLDLEGRPLAGLAVCRMRPFVTLLDEFRSLRGEPTDDCATSDADGRFTITAPRLGWFVVTTPGWTTVLGGDVMLAEHGEALLVAARAQALAGSVVDVRGNPLSDVEVSLEVAAESLLALGTVLDATMRVPRVLDTRDDGAFAFDDAPRGRLVVTAWKEGYARASLDLAVTAEPCAPVRFVLETSTLPTVTGTVVDPAGRPVERALVSAGQTIVTSDASGAFLVTFDPGHWSRHADTDHSGREAPSSIVVRAVHAELGVGELEVPLAPSMPAVRVVLEHARRAIAGRVLDPRGAPVPGVEVFVLEDTLLGLEPLDGSGFYARSVESALGAEPARTAVDGSFRIVGLLEGSYRLQALDTEHVSSSISEPIAAGSEGVRLELDPRTRGPLAGRVVDRNGVPVPGVRVAVSCRQWWSGPGDCEYALVFGTPAVSDDEGRFALADVSHVGVFLRLEGDPIVPEIFRELDPAADPEALELVVGRRCHLQLRWGDWNTRADRMHLEDADGATLEFMDLRGFSVTPLEGIPIDGALSPALAIPDRTAAAVLTRRGAEVDRVPVHPVPGELEILDP